LSHYDTLDFPISCPCKARLEGTEYATVQSAIDASSDGSDVVKVTGRCYAHDVVVDNTLTLQGGWNSDFTLQDLTAYASTLDAQGEGRALVVSGGSPVVEALHLINGHTGEKGGGVYVGDGTPTLRNNVIHNNISVSDGGGVYLGGDAATLIGNRIFNNAATGYDGGGIAIGGFSTATLEGNIVIGNSAYRNAGGIFADYQTDVTLINKVIADNTCCASIWSVGGSGIWLSRGITCSCITPSSTTREAMARRSGSPATRR